MRPQLSKPIKSILSVRIPGRNNPSSTNTTWDVTIGYPPEAPNGIITTITPHSEHPYDHDSGSGYYLCSPLLLPALTHPHIHLDKAFIHNNPDYAHIYPLTGSFSEALSHTTQAKSCFSRSDLLRRGEWLLAESVASGVTSVRAFVEVDSTVNTTCLDVGIELKRKWAGVCEVQIVCFAQDPVFSGPVGDANRGVIEKVLFGGDYAVGDIDVLGTTPYVEDCEENAKSNVNWAVQTAMASGLHLDFHLDYHLDSSKEAMVWDVLHALGRGGWTGRNDHKRVMLGHCTRLTLFEEKEWKKLALAISSNDLPVSFVGLPTSDLYMASPPVSAHISPPHVKQRGTLNVLDMIHNNGLDAVIGVNNVGNAFTPWGSPDPLSLACFGVGVYQAGAQKDTELLYECISTRAREAINIGNSGATNTDSTLALKEGDPANFLLLYNVDETGCGMARRRGSVAEVVWNPPSISSRDVITGGRLVVKPMAAERVRSAPSTAIVYAE